MWGFKLPRILLVRAQALSSWCSGFVWCRANDAASDIELFFLQLMLSAVSYLRRSDPSASDRSWFSLKASSFPAAAAFPTKLCRRVSTRRTCPSLPRLSDLDLLDHHGRRKVLALCSLCLLLPSHSQLLLPPILEHATNEIQTLLLAHSPQLSSNEQPRMLMPLGILLPQLAFPRNGDIEAERKEGTADNHLLLLLQRPRPQPATWII